VLPCPPACPEFVTFGSVYPVNFFNLIVFGDFNASWTRVAGRVAVGGNLTITTFAEIGRGLFKPELSCFDTFDEVWLNQLIVGGSITWDRGKVFSGNILVGTEFSNNQTISENLAEGCELLLNSTLLNFDDLKNSLQSLSEDLFGLEQTVLNVSLNEDSGELVIWLDNSEKFLTFGSDGKFVEVIHVDADVLLGARNVTIFENLDDDHLFNTSAVIVFNVLGEVCGFDRLDFYNAEPWSNRIIWNFVNCTNMTIVDTSIMGSVLAVNANVTNATGLVFGTVIVNNLTLGSFFEFEWERFDGCQVLPPEVPEICEVLCLPAPINTNNTQCDCLRFFDSSFDQVGPALTSLGDCMSDIIAQVCVTAGSDRPACNRCAHDCCRPNIL
jgi:choice-of-anchor A domain-containing protein